MANQKIKKIVYVTSSEFKIKENEVFSRCAVLSDGTRVSEAFTFDIRKVPIKELLEVDLEVMVQAEAISAYSQLKVPCIVEHAGLIFDRYKDRSYPGGLTKPMWDTLKDKFLQETNSANTPAIARAVIAYCNGKSVKTFVGETYGTLTTSPRGDREFYWDTVFAPDRNSNTETKNLTYAEIVKQEGLEAKIKELSQSTKAMKKFLEYYKNESNDLWI